jgi:hypothetical protein
LDKGFWRERIGLHDVACSGWRWDLFDSCSRLAFQRIITFPLGFVGGILAKEEDISGPLYTTFTNPYKGKRKES